MLSLLRAGVLYAALSFAAGFVLGTLRTLFIMPQTGPTMAVAIELPLMLAVSWAVCRYALLRKSG